MDYEKQKQIWLKRRITIQAWLAIKVPRKEIAKRLKITRQRLSQIENGK